MDMQPAVTVLLAVYNDERYLPLAIESVLSQTFGDFEFVIINDGSTDGCHDYLAHLCDTRLRVIHNKRNAGLAASLNRGLDISRGKYIARMDADDVCEPDRLQRQVEFLDGDQHVGVLGTSRRLIDEDGAQISVATAPRTDRAIRWKCLLGNPFGHPTVMLRRSVFEEHRLRYDPAYHVAQDYELWTRVLQHTCGANLSEPLLRYRIRRGHGQRNKTTQLENHDQIAHAACARLMPQFELSLKQVRNLRGRYGGFSVREPDMNPADPQWLELYRHMFEKFMETSPSTCSLPRPG